jgi:cation diffusion facilitator family transporter
MNNEEKIAYKVSFVSIVSNILLTIIKFISGVISHSQAMISDSIHSLSDVLSTFVVIIGVKISNKQADKSHPYGHERLECVAALILSIMLFITGFLIGYSGVKNIILNKTIKTPGLLALIASIISIIVKELMYWYTVSIAKKINSGALKADAWHHRSDALSSVGSFVGILGSRLGFKVLDPLASVIICLFIFKVSIDIFSDSIDKMVDKSCDTETINKIIEIIERKKEVLKVDDIKTRQFGNKAYIDLEISVEENMILKDAHAVAEKIHDEIEEEVPIIKHCMIHVNPSKISE